MIIKIKDLQVETIVGIYKWERKIHQKITINIELEFDGTAAARSDKIEDTVDYALLSERIVQFVESSSFNLVESLVERVLDIIMQDEKITQATVEIDKPQALKQAQSISIRQTRIRV